MRPCLCEGRAEMGVIAACLGVAMRGGGAWLRGGAGPNPGAGREGTARAASGSGGFSLETQIWICKPTASNQGKGIFLLRNQEEVAALQAKIQSIDHDPIYRKMPLRAPQPRVVQRCGAWAPRGVGQGGAGTGPAGACGGSRGSQGPQSPWPRKAVVPAAGPLRSPQRWGSHRRLGSQRRQPHGQRFMDVGAGQGGLGPFVAQPGPCPLSCRRASQGRNPYSQALPHPLPSRLQPSGLRPGRPPLP